MPRDAPALGGVPLAACDVDGIRVRQLGQADFDPPPAMLVIRAGEWIPRAEPSAAYTARHAVIDAVGVDGDQSGAGLHHGE